MIDYKGVKIRTIHAAFEKMKEEGKLDRFLDECDRKQAEAIVTKETYDLALRAMQDDSKGMALGTHCPIVC